MQSVDKELRHILSKTKAQAMMDELMVSFSMGQNYHYNYYFDTQENDLFKKDIMLRCRTILENGEKTSILSLKIPSLEEHTFLEYHQTLTDEEMEKMVYHNMLPYGEIKELTAIHGGIVFKRQTIRVSRVYAHYKDLALYFDKITIRGIPSYEIGAKIPSGPFDTTTAKVQIFYDFLNDFEETYTQAPRRSYNALKETLQEK